MAQHQRVKFSKCCSCTYTPLTLRGFYILIQIDFTGYLLVENQKVCAVDWIYVLFLIHKNNLYHVCQMWLKIYLAKTVFQYKLT